MLPLAFTKAIFFPYCCFFSGIDIGCLSDITGALFCGPGTFCGARCFCWLGTVFLTFNAFAIKLPGKHWGFLVSLSAWCLLLAGNCFPYLQRVKLPGKHWGFLASLSAWGLLVWFGLYLPLSEFPLAPEKRVLWLEIFC